MNQTIISRLVVGALAALAATSSFAGQIQSSSVSIAREVITSDSQVISSPAVSYRFAGDVDARVQTQVFQVQLTLSSGAWASAGTVGQIAVTDGVDGVIWTQNATAGAQTYQVVGLGLSTDKKTLFATVQVDTFATKSVLKQPLITFAAAATKPTINGLYSVTKAIADCDTAVYNTQVNVSHFTALSSPSAIAVAGVNGVPDEHLRSGATNTGTLIVFPTNILVKWTPSTGSAKIDVTTSQQSLSGTSSVGTWTSFINTTLANLGKVELVQNSSGYDTDLANQYLLTGNPAGNGIDEKATAALTNGNVEAKSFDVVITPSNGFAVGSVVSLGTTLDCASANLVVNSAALNATTASSALTVSVPATVNQLGFGNTGLGPLYVCYTVPGNTVVPNSAFTVKGTLTKSAAGANLNEQNNACSGSLYPLGGSVKVDVRNYANSKDPGKWMSVIRLINPDEVRTIDVYGQLIQTDGLYGPWGKLVSLAPRAVVNLTASQVDALLVNAPAHTTTANNGSSTPVATATGARLRITSPNAQTLRVQNYLYNPASQNFIEASGTQGVDFSGSTDRAPSSDGQYQQQDAWTGLNGQ